MPIATGTLIDDRLIIEELVGQGGMGSVYRAKQVGLDRPVAVKFLTLLCDKDSEPYRRFEREAQLLCGMRHQNIVAFYGYGIWNQYPYMIVELIEGTTLEDRVKAGGPLEEEDAFSIIAQVCTALDFAHSHGVVHRDLKPENIVSTADGLVKVIDFGLAKSIATKDEQVLTEAGSTVGTVLYMSPEQCLGESCSSLSDIYALGCVMYFALTGAPPYSGDNTISVMQSHVLDDIPQLSERTTKLINLQRYQYVVETCLAKDSGSRFQTANQIAAELTSPSNTPSVIKANGKSSSTSHSIFVKPSAQAKDRLVPKLTLALCVLCVTGFALQLFPLKTKHSPPPDQAKPSDLRAKGLFNYWLENQTESETAGLETLERIKHATILHRGGQEYSSTWDKDARILNKMSDAWFRRGQNSLIRSMLLPLEKYERELAPNGLTHAETLIRLGRRHEDSSESTSVIEQYAEAKKICEDLPANTDNARSAGIFQALASFNQRRGKLREAINDLIVSDKLWEKSNESECELAAITLFRLGRLQSQTNANGTLQTLNRAFVKLRKVKLWEQAELSASLMAGLQLMQGDLAEAHMNIERAESILPSVKGPRGVVARNNLLLLHASDMLALKGYDKALQFALQAKDQYDATIANETLMLAVNDQRMSVLNDRRAAYTMAAALYAYKKDLKNACAIQRRLLEIDRLDGLGDSAQTAKDESQLSRWVKELDKAGR